MTSTQKVQSLPEKLHNVRRGGNRRFSNQWRLARLMLALIVLASSIPGAVQAAPGPDTADSTAGEGLNNSLVIQDPQPEPGSENSEAVTAAEPVTNTETTPAFQVDASVRSRVFLPTIMRGHRSQHTGPSTGWPMVAANPARTSWTADDVPGGLKPVWFTRFDSYISQKVQIIAYDDLLYLAASDGLHALNAQNGSEVWFYPTELPLGHSPTIDQGVAYVGGFDKKIHAINAKTGQGLWTFQGGAGFQTNPLVIEGKLFAGNRDGYFYAIHVSGSEAGQLAWKYQTDGPVLFSAAYAGGTVYFASNDNHAYALRAQDGQLVWKSPKLPGHGFHSYWPVVYGDYVIFGGSFNYRYDEPFATSHNKLESQEAFPPGLNNKDPIGPIGKESGSWMPGTETITNNAAAQYFEQYPHRRTYFVLSRSNGQELTYDSDNDGQPEYAPILWLGTHSGTRYPAVVGPDNILYQANSLFYNEYIPRGKISGWKIGTPVISVPAASGNAVDEPVAYAVGGNTIYWKRCCDRLAGAFEISKSSGSAADLQSWNYYNEGGSALRRTFPALFEEEWDFAYWKHGDQSPPIPYKGKVYVFVNNAIVAFAPDGLKPVLPSNPDNGTDTGEEPKEIERESTVSGLNVRVTAGNAQWPLVLSQETYYNTNIDPGVRGRHFRLLEVRGSEGANPGSLQVQENSVASLLTSTFEGSQTLRTWTSRRVPTTLFENSSAIYQLSAGLTGIAYPTAGGVRVQTSETTINGADLSGGWLLIWDSSGQHRWSPIVLSLQKRPAQVNFSPSGLKLSFTAQAGFLGVTPLYGMSAPVSSEARAWSGGIPQETLQRVQLLDRLAKAFPDDGSESWAIQESSGDVSLSYGYHFITVSDDWGTQPLRMAALPPQLALAAWNGSPIRVNEKTLDNQLDLGYVTPLGRVAGVPDSDSVTVRLPGLAGYWRNAAPSGANASGDPLQAILVREVQKMLEAGHLMPAYNMVGIWDAGARYKFGDNLNDPWKNPADTVITLLRALPLLPADMQAQVRQYVQNEFQQYPPYKVVHVGWNAGANRERFDLPPEVVQEAANVSPKENTPFNGWEIPPQNFYAVWMYAKEFGGAAELFQQTQKNMKLEVNFENSTPYVLNSYIAGYVGYLRLADLASAGRQANVERTLVDLLVHRAALSKYPLALEQTGFEYGGYSWALRFFSPYQPDTLFEANVSGSLWSQLPLYGFTRDIIYGYSGASTGGNYTFTLDFVNLMPETARFLRDYAGPETQLMVDTYTRRAPYWFVGRVEEAAGEGVLQPPYDRWGVFQAKALALQTSRNELEQYLDVPMVKIGDLYYIQNLVATLQAGR